MKSRNHRVTLANLVALVGYARHLPTAGVPAKTTGLRDRAGHQEPASRHRPQNPGRVRDYRPRQHGTPARRGGVHDRATGWQWAGLALLVLPMLMLSTDLTVLFLAMPTLSQDPSTA